MIAAVLTPEQLQQLLTIEQQHAAAVDDRRRDAADCDVAACDGAEPSDRFSRSR
jgi:hypothetical protein